MGTDMFGTRQGRSGPAPFPWENTQGYRPPGPQPIREYRPINWGPPGMPNQGYQPLPSMMQYRPGSEPQPLRQFRPINWGPPGMPGQPYQPFPETQPRFPQIWRQPPPSYFGNVNRLRPNVHVNPQGYGHMPPMGLPPGSTNPYMQALQGG